MNKVIDKYKEPFIEMLEDMCVKYKLIGFADRESPMWLQYTGVHNEDEQGRPKFKSSQCSLGFFLNYIDEDDKLYFNGVYSELYDFFKRIKYKYIEDNHPTIYKELRGS
jgi:hypothetical protein